MILPGTERGRERDGQRAVGVGVRGQRERETDRELLALVYETSAGGWLGVLTGTAAWFVRGRWKCWRIIQASGYG